MDAPQDTVYINIEYFDGNEEGDDGTPYYVASCNELKFITEGETFEELLTNIGECLALTLREVDSVEYYNVLPDAHIKKTGLFRSNLCC
jgi:predicted RNase H-like HicB family nuclease